MRLSRSFIPTMKETPAEAQIASHRLMLRAGLVRQTSAGIYAWLPLGYRVLQQYRAHRARGAERGRRAGSADADDPAGRVVARERSLRRLRQGDAAHPRPARARHAVRADQRGDDHRSVPSVGASYRELPQILYHIQWKFRDEVRPRFGVMRGREFLMKDAYSFDLDYAGAVVSYRTMMLAYMRTFQRMGLKAIPMEADSGPIGGDLSHEFIILAPTGESQVYYDAEFENIDWVNSQFGYNAEDLEAFFERMTSMYAATDEKHDPDEVGTGRSDAAARRAWHRGRPHLLLRDQVHQGDEHHGGRGRTAGTCIRRAAATASASRVWSAR